RHMEELDWASDARAGRVRHLDHDRHVFRLDAMLVQRAAVAEMVAELDRSWHRLADPRQDADRLGAEIDRARLVITLPGEHFLAHAPLHTEAADRAARGSHGQLGSSIPPQ